MVDNDDYALSVEQIAAGLAHEVKNPLALVRANIDLLELNDGNGIYKQNYSIMRRELDRINELLLDFIQFSKPAGIDFESVCLNDCLKKVLDSFELSHSGRISVEWSPPEEPIFAIADERKLERVFINILKNAVEAAEEMPLAVIKVGLSREYDFAVITFSDNGKGITPEEAYRVSEPFFTTKRGGSGLGIYVSKSIIHEHDGDFDISVNENGGCTVTVRLPYALT